jgi:hypothetical protein
VTTPVTRPGDAQSTPSRCRRRVRLPQGSIRKEEHKIVQRCSSFCCLVVSMARQSCRSGVTPPPACIAASPFAAAAPVLSSCENAWALELEASRYGAHDFVWRWHYCTCVAMALLHLCGDGTTALVRRGTVGQTLSLFVAWQQLPLLALFWARWFGRWNFYKTGRLFQHFGQLPLFFNRMCKFITD